jgi:hypothetical protein
MNDPIKDFVEQHREEFDHLEAPVFKLEQLKKRIQCIPSVQKKKFSIVNGSKWLVAASILIALTGAWFFFYNNDQEKPVVQLAAQKPTTAPENKVKTESQKVGPARKADKAVFIGDPATRSMSVAKIRPLSVAKVQKVEQKVKQIGVPAADRYARLKDSTSASSRLLAILEMEKEDRMDNELLQMLTLTLNHDKNTNVRLAALSLMEKFNYDGHVANSLVSSLDKQDDPIVQLGLVSILGKMKNVNIDDRLESLARSPETFAAVRDEAYRILLKQNKL